MEAGPIKAGPMEAPACGDRGGGGASPACGRRCSGGTPFRKISVISGDLRRISVSSV